MKILNIAIALFATLIMCSCEKLDTQQANSTATEEAVNDQASVYHISDFINGEVTENFADDNGIVIKGVWLEGYIVGYISGTSIKSAVFSSGDKKSNIILAENPMIKNASKCVPIQLSVSPNACNEVRNALNLSDNPKRLGTKVRVYGDIQKYMSVAGLKNVKKYVELPDDFDYDNYVPEKGNNSSDTSEKGDYDDDDYYDEDDDDWDDDDWNDDDDGYYDDDNNPVIDYPLDDDLPDDSGTKDPVDDSSGTSPDGKYTVNAILGSLTKYLVSHNIEEINGTVLGYIVGYVNGSKITSTVFGTNGAKGSNIVIADSPNENNPEKCIAIQLSSSSTYVDVRNTLNLVEHPDNLHKYVSISGTITKYMGVLGLKNTYRCSFK